VAWRFEHSEDSAANPQAVWRHYLDVPNWCDWSQQGVEWSRLDGPFEVGTKGQSKPPGSRPLRFRLVAVEPDAYFATEARLPGGRLRFDHVIEPRDSGVRITHRVTLSGPLAFLYAPVVKKSVKQGLPDGVDRLAAMAALDR
jgi:hypothetical protein